jgi:NAD(P)-dependent dehydrogenase (short-subunit alcohol dehydrogenase family)
MMLGDRVILVTGGSSGIGRAAVRLLAEAGAKLVVVSRHAAAADEIDRLLREAGAEGVHVAGDVTKDDDVARCVAAAVTRFGRLDGALNNASSGKGVFATLADFAPHDFDEAISDGLRSVFLCMRAELRAMLEQAPRPDGARGAIVNVASVNGLGAAPQGSLYAAAKAGVIALSKGGALDYAAHGIRVNALVPGAFATPLLDSVFERAAAGAGVTKEVVAASYAGRVPLGRVGAPEEGAQAACWLLSDASSYVTGSSLIVDGGMTAFAR